MVDIPAHAAELTAPWLTKAMRRTGTLDNETAVRSFTLEPLAGAGKGLSGDTTRVVLDYEGPGTGPRSLVVKFPTDALVNRGMVESLDCYAREIAFYRDLGGEVPLRIPAHLGSEMDEHSPGLAEELGNRVVDRLPGWLQLALTKDVTKFLRPSKRRYALLLEDMGAGATVYDMADPPAVADVRRTLVALATLHGRFWGRDDLHGHRATRELVTPIPRVYSTVYKRRCRAMANERWADWLDPAAHRLLDLAVAGFVDDVRVVNEGLTLVHGDPRSDNLLFSGDDAEVVVLDWALTAVGHPGYDVSYLLGSSLRPADAGEVPGLLADYLDAARAAGADLTATELRRGVLAATRTTTVQQVISIPVLEGTYDGDAMPADLWTPRLLALLDALSPQREGR